MYVCMYIIMYVCTYVCMYVCLTHKSYYMCVLNISTYMRLSPAISAARGLRTFIHCWLLTEHGEMVK